MTKKDLQPVAEKVNAKRIVREDQPITEAGRWYWIEDEDYHGKKQRYFACVTHVGSNYVALRSPSRHTWRVHFKDFDTQCTEELAPQHIIDSNIEEAKAEVREYMEEVRAITARLGVGQKAIDSGPSETAMTLSTHAGPIGEYKTALVKAKEHTLPELFKKIEGAHESLSSWMKANLIPMKAAQEGMKGVIGIIEDRLFNVELYAGLIETVTQIKKGEPAETGEQIHLMQRRCYMDEECLARYEAGGMEFKDIRAFDRWLCKPESMTRILPFERTVVAFQVRRKEKERECPNLKDFINILYAVEMDKKTFLFIRNGKQVFRLSTDIEFQAKLFPDLDQAVLTGTGALYSKRDNYHPGRIITEAMYLGMVEEENRKIAERDKLPKKEQFWRHIDQKSRDYEPFTKDSVYFDDTSAFLAGEVAKHNRLVLVLQGLLDRSPVFHPHPTWTLWNAVGFNAALKLIFDDTRALVAGEKPDFEAYRAKLNTKLRVGSITVGQEDAWERHEAVKESNRMDRTYTGRRSDYRPSHVRPYGDPGPGTLAEVKYIHRNGKCTFKWLRQRSGMTRWQGNNGLLPTSYDVGQSLLLNVSAYKPGDFRMFYDDPRTRADYLEWAPLLLEAEEFHAGNRKVGTEPTK
ncbi:MAG: hypothetical protein A2Y38_17465 [Spirochaetes bacterium GWB1_59_5]|nr:MAG: hypothetical protein A2Y38_17465 [Spirochaetes bacterium GWB1_59_5]